VGPATGAFDTIYSLTECERERYATLGIESPRVRWGIHPELLAYARDLAGTDPATYPGPPARASSGSLPPVADDGPGAPLAVRGSLAEDLPGGDVVRFLFPGGFMSKRKPLAEVLEAFQATDGESLRLLLKAQVSRRVKAVRRAARRDPRIEVIWDELPTEDYLRLFASMDVCLAPSRWEGLGLHLYEATAFGLPIITNDSPPMNEIVADGVNGVLVEGIPDGEARSGIPAYRPDVSELSAAIERLSDPELRQDLASGARRRREDLPWEDTVSDLAALLGSAVDAPQPE
jgi:glycosyltransferase involved in cell wall biosynthesis